MTKKNSTKRALVTSVLAIVLCLTMLIGTTFAWFTDTATTGVNKITSGNLHVEIQDETGAKIRNLEWKTADNRAQEQILWEPGATYTLTPFKIVNTGNLALKYKLVVTGLDGDSELLDVIHFTYKLGDAELDLNDEGHLAANGGATGMITVSAHMDEAAGNEYQDKTLNGISINVVATQYTYENDSTGNQYDKDATYPVLAGTQEELTKAITDAGTNPVTVKLAEGTYTLPSKDNMDLTIIGTEDTVIDIPTAIAPHGATITMEGVTVQSPNANYTGIQHVDTTIFRNCTIVGQPFLYAKDAQFIGCTFTQDSSNAYNVWTYGAGTVLFKDCTFNCAGKSVLIYNEGSIPRQTVEFENCKFNATASVAGKAAIEIDSSLLPNGATYTVIIDKATADNVTGFGTGNNSGNSVWNNKKGTKATVIVDGETVLSAS